MAQETQGPTGEPTGGPELTWVAVGLGLILSVVMGAANVYLGLRAGMTVSASIPAAVIAIGVLRGVFRRRSILEANLVQTAASAGESLSAGIIFTIPALLITGVWQHFDYWTTTAIALCGGLLGIIFMIPMRQVFVIGSPQLKFPEGVACAEVLRAGSVETSDDETDDTSGMGLIVGGIVVGAGFKFLQSFLGLLRGTAEVATVRGGRLFYFGADISPALFAVGFIITLPLALQIFAGGVLGWLVGIPWLSAGVELGDSTVASAHAIWSGKVRYIGVGAMIVGGVSSIWTVRSGLRAAVRQMAGVFGRAQKERTVDPLQQNLSPQWIVSIGVVVLIVTSGLFYWLLDGVLGVTVLSIAAVVSMSFFFTAVASYIVGLVGNSNSPVSGMTISALLATGGMLWLAGYAGTAGIVATLGVAGVVCCAACTSGDVCNDLKTGHLVGASPRRQQIMQVLGVLVAAFVMAPVMTVLHEGSLRAGGKGIGDSSLPAPQANLFAALTSGFFTDDGQLPMGMVAVGAALGILLLVADQFLRSTGSPLRLHVMPVAVGIYLPFGLSVPILLGGIIRFLVDRRGVRASDAEGGRGVLLSSGIIAGESLIGVLLGFLAYRGIHSWSAAENLLAPLGWSPAAEEVAVQSLSVLALLGVAAWTYRRAVRV